MGAAIFFCCYFRYQTLLPESSRLSKSKSRFIIVFVLLSCSIPATEYAAFPFDSSLNEELIKTSRFNLTWVIGRGPYFIHERSRTVLNFIAITIVLTVGASMFFIAIFFRMFKLLSRNESHSRVTVRKIRRSLFIMFVQLCLPFVTLAIPVVVMFGGLFYENIPFSQF
ncbi:hypothetical protein PRIPAC_80192 [Pristionchus pacificus]|nr:hypothetical protein PRIPAC_80192 [Pristionchus pacificus]